MALTVPIHTPLPDTPDTIPLAIVPESLFFKQKLQTHLSLFAKALLKESTHDITLLSHEAHNFACAPNNTLPKLTVGIGRTSAWQQEMLCTAFREISE